MCTAVLRFGFVLHNDNSACVFKLGDHTAATDTATKASALFCIVLHNDNAACVFKLGDHTAATEMATKASALFCIASL